MERNDAALRSRGSRWILAAVLGVVAGGCERPVRLIADAGPGSLDIEVGDIVLAVEDDGSVADAKPATDERPPPDVIPAYSGCVRGTFTPYWGDVHAHSKYSTKDAAELGAPEPAGAFEYARDISKMDLLIITDHRGMLTSATWSACLTQAKAATTVGSFVADCGLEIALAESDTNPDPSDNHGNVLFPTGTLDSWPVTPTRPDYYARIAQCSSCVGQFNHATWDDWLYLKYESTGGPKMRLVEMQSSWFETLFTALNHGWRVSPTLNEDNHDGTYGASGHRSGFFMASLDRDALRESMLSRRTFATSDPNASLRLMLGSCWMGSALSGAGSATRTLPFFVEAKDQDATDKFDHIDILGPVANQATQSQPLGTVACSGEPSCAGTIWLSITPPTFLVAHAKQKDDQGVISAPIWIEK